MPAWTGAAAIAIIGLTALTRLITAPQDGTRLVAVVVPPWVEGGTALSSGVALVDLRWGGRVMILDTGGDGRILARLRLQGYWVMDATGLRGCGRERTSG